MPLVLIIGDTHGTQKGVLKDLSKQRKRLKENGKTASHKDDKLAWWKRLSFTFPFFALWYT